MTSIDPATDEQSGFHTINDVADWTGTAGVAGTLTTARGALLNALGLNGNEHPRIVGNRPSADYDAIVAVWRIEGPTGEGGGAGPQLPPYSGSTEPGWAAGEGMQSESRRATVSSGSRRHVGTGTGSLAGQHE